MDSDEPAPVVKKEKKVEKEDKNARTVNRTVVEDCLMTVFEKRKEVDSPITLNWVFATEEKSCRHCNAGLTSGNKKSHCRNCGAIVCASCVKMGTIRQIHEKKPLELCQHCNTHLHGSDPITAAKDGDSKEKKCGPSKSNHCGSCSKGASGGCCAEKCGVVSKWNCAKCKQTCCCSGLFECCRTCSTCGHLTDAPKTESKEAKKTETVVATKPGGARPKVEDDLGFDLFD